MLLMIIFHIPYFIFLNTSITLKYLKDPLFLSGEERPLCDYVLSKLFKFRITRAEFSNQTRSLVMIVPAYATAHMSQIHIYWSSGKNAAFLNRSSKHFRCVPLRFPISMLWEFNLIPTDISPGTGLKKINKEKKKKRKQKNLDRLKNFVPVEEHQDIWVSISPCLSVAVAQTIFTEIILSYLPGSGRAGHGAEGLLWTNPPQSQ